LHTFAVRNSSIGSMNRADTLRAGVHRLAEELACGLRSICPVKNPSTQQAARASTVRELSLRRSVPYFLATSREFGQEFAENGVVHRLHQMGVKARFLGPAAILILPPSGQGH
jgi:hypothetical protein